MVNVCAKGVRRRGIEVVEVALTLPLLTVTLFGMIEITHRWHLEKMLKLATHESMKAGADVGGDSEVAEDVFLQHTAAIGINGAELLIGPTVEEFDNGAEGQILELTGTAPASLNRAVTPPIINDQRDLSGGRITYWRESL